MDGLDAYLVPALDGIAYGLLLFVVAAGLTLCFGVANILNLAHGTLYSVGAYSVAALSHGGWGSLLFGLAAGTLAAAVAGAALAILLAPLTHREATRSPDRAGAPARHAGHLGQALLTFGAALAGGSLLVDAFGPDNPPVRIPAVLDRPIALAGHPYPAYRLGFILTAGAIAVLLYLTVARTRAGMLVRASADDAEMVACLGVSPARVRFGALATAGALAGLAGALGAPIIGPGPGTAGTVLLLSLVVVVLGGLGSVPGTLLAALAVGEIQSLGVTLAPAAAPFLLFSVMAVMLALRSSALPRRWSAA